MKRLIRFLLKKYASPNNCAECRFYFEENRIDHAKRKLLLCIRGTAFYGMKLNRVLIGVLLD